jgi:hypothetical protein
MPNHKLDLVVAFHPMRFQAVLTPDSSRHYVAEQFGRIPSIRTSCAPAGLGSILRVMGRLDGKMAVVLGAAGRGDMGQVIAQRFRDEDAQDSLIQISSATATIMLNDHAWSRV